MSFRHTYRKGKGSDQSNNKQPCKAVFRSIIWQYPVELKMDILSDPTMPLLNMRTGEMCCVCSRRHVWWQSDSILTDWVYWAQPCYSALLGRAPPIGSQRGGLHHCYREAAGTPFLWKLCCCIIPPAQTAGPLQGCALPKIPRAQPNYHFTLFLILQASSLYSGPLGAQWLDRAREAAGHSPGLCLLTGWQKSLLLPHGC